MPQKNLASKNELNNTNQQKNNHMGGLDFLAKDAVLGQHKGVRN